MPNDPQSLAALRGQLENILTALSNLELPAYRPPLIDSCQDGDTISTDPNDVPGLKQFRTAITRELENIVKFTSQPSYQTLPPLSTNALYYLAVWNEMIASQPPLLSVGKKFDLPKVKGQPKVSVKVDIVAEQGRSWIRVNTTKNARLLAEFREIDSYLTGSEDESTDGAGEAAQDEASDGDRPAVEFDNSLLRMGRSLIAAANHNQISGPNGQSVAPRVTMCLTRLEPDQGGEDNDPRIAQTISMLREIGVNIQLGDNPQPPPVAPPSTDPLPLQPTLAINLDLSLLVALASDLTHAPLPTSVEEAESRYRTSGYAAGLRKASGKGKERPEDADDMGEHTRAVANQTLQEMGQALVDIITSTVTAAKTSPEDEIQFWTTKEAKVRFLAIMAKIGGEGERLRGLAMFAEDGVSVEQFWKGSRFHVDYMPGLPIKVFPEDSPASLPGLPLPTTLFHERLAATCRSVLATPPTPAALATWSPVWQQSNGGPPPALRLTSRFTAHTVQSLQWGAVTGMTTLSANKASIKAILREMGSFAGLGGQDGSMGTGETYNKAALWAVEPRSLAEGMRRTSLI